MQVTIEREKAKGERFQLWEWSGCLYIVDTLSPRDKAIFVGEGDRCSQSFDNNSVVIENGTRVTEPTTITLKFNQ